MIMNGPCRSRCLGPIWEALSWLSELQIPSRDFLLSNESSSNLDHVQIPNVAASSDLDTGLFKFQSFMRDSCSCTYYVAASFFRTPPKKARCGSKSLARPLWPLCIPSFFALAKSRMPGRPQTGRTGQHAQRLHTPSDHLPRQCNG